MKVCIVGAGAIGGFIGARLAATGNAQVSAVARGATLQSLRQHGWRLRTGGELLTGPVRAEDNPVVHGVQDLVIIAVKAQSLPALAAGIAPLIGPDTVVMPAMNGVPWWFCREHVGFGEAPLETVDPGGTVSDAIPFRQVLGCVVHASCAMPEPGLVQHNQGDGLIIGEPSGGMSQRAAQIVELLVSADFKASQSDNIRHDIWYKLWGNMTINPISAITGATVDRILSDRLVRDFCSGVMQEAALLGSRLGCQIDQSPEERHEMTARLGAFKTSMLQDVEANRPIELDAIVAAVYEIAARLDVPCPSTAALLGLARLFGRVHHLYPEKVSSA